jgi:hypothetical protein
MKRLNNFLDKAPLWQVYIFGWIFTGTFISLLFYFFQFIDGTSTAMLLTGENCIKMGIATGAIFGLMVMLMVSMMRKSQVFWDFSKEVEAKIENAKTKDELDFIFENEFQDLRKKCQGGPQIPELNRLYTIMKTKYKFL